MFLSDIWVIRDVLFNWAKGIPWIIQILKVHILKIEREECSYWELPGTEWIHEYQYQKLKSAMTKAWEKGQEKDKLCP